MMSQMLNKGMSIYLRYKTGKMWSRLTNLKSNIAPENL